MLHYRIHGFLLTELTVPKTFQGYAYSLKNWENSNESTLFYFANIWKAALAPFAPSTKPLEATYELFLGIL